MTILKFEREKRFYNELEFFDDFCDDEERKRILQDLEPGLDKYGRENFYIAIEETYGSFNEFVETVLKERNDSYTHVYKKIGDVEYVKIKKLINPSDNCPKCDSDEIDWDEGNYDGMDYTSYRTCSKCEHTFCAEYTLVKVRANLWRKF